LQPLPERWGVLLETGLYFGQHKTRQVFDIRACILENVVR
jgi:hypothetical protein